MSYTIKDILKMEVAPALGCTEPVAVALCASAAASLLAEGTIDAIDLWLDSNIYKNGMAAAIPGAEGGTGIDLAAALGALGGDPSLQLEVLRPLNSRIVRSAKEFVKAGKVNISLREDKRSIFVKAKLSSGNDVAEAVIEDLHDNITDLRRNGNSLTEHPLLSCTAKSRNDVVDLEKWLSSLTLRELVQLVDELDEDDLAFVREGIDCNLELAKHGLTYGPGLGIGMTLERLVKEGLLKKDMILAARILSSAACDARMSGARLPAMSSAGSGNHGLTAVLPIWAVKDYLACDDERMVLKATALSHVITCYVKAHTGRLSAVCGCSVAAGAGATAGITYLMSGNLAHIAGAIKNLISDLAGVICDGAKASCSLKLATAAGTAVQSALLALHGIDVKGTDGIIASTPEGTMKNVGQLSVEGMVETDRTILQIMMEKQFSGQ